LSGEVILRPKRHSWADFYALAEKTQIPADFMGKADRLANDPVVDPFGDLAE
jgi:antitoxin VapB